MVTVACLTLEEACQQGLSHVMRDGHFQAYTHKSDRLKCSVSLKLSRY